MVRRRTVVSFAAAGLLLASPLLTACGSGPAHTGAAAVVGDHRITVSTLQAQVDRLRDAAAGSPQVAQSLAQQSDLNTSVLNGLVLDQVLERTLSDQGITISDGDVRHQREAALQQQFGGNESALETYFLANYHVAPKDIDHFIRRSVAFTAIIQHAGYQPGSDGGNVVLEQTVSRTAKELGVTINPRYGTWDARQLQIGAVSDPWVVDRSKPAQPSGA